MNKPFFILLVILFSVACTHQSTTTKQSAFPNEITLSKEVFMDKIKGGWAGQTIGCTYGGPTEFRFSGTMIQDYVPILWPDGYIKHSMLNDPGLYDDIYMDLTFVEIFDRLGLDAPADSFAIAFATAGYGLAEANQAARCNILQGIMPPQSGHWLNNPHADDIDYQIEADFAGLMSPGMPNAASEVSDKIGHIMNYGDGWYGGVYIGAMYSLAFISDDIEFVVTEALKTIPEESRYYQCMNDVINWHKQYPDDWKQTWFECEKKWNQDIGCPNCVFVAYNIDAVINSAYVLIGLLYGGGDFFKTIDISTRCGQDSDCNPASAGGILGTMLGYSNIPEKWIKNLREAEDIDFAHTTISLNDTYQMSYRHALQMIERNNGRISENDITIKCQRPVAVRYEKGFDGHFPVKQIIQNKLVEEAGELSFEGIGVVIRCIVRSSDDDYVAKVEVYLDGNLEETVNLPANSLKRRLDIFWKYQLPKGRHTVSFKWLNPDKNAKVNIGDVLIYSDAPDPSQVNLY